jgi:hypothetical protein
MCSYPSNHQHRANKGSVLAISLVILTAITLISISALQRSGTQGRMVGNMQHKEQSFHAANGELEEIYNFFATQASATQALSVPLNSFEFISGEQVFLPVEPGHESTYNNYLPNQGNSTRLDVTSSIVHTGIASSLVAGFSIGSFAEYGFIVSAQSSTPNLGVAAGRTLSDQSIGITFIAPASLN